jgi:hypothetical protein
LHQPHFSRRIINDKNFLQELTNLCVEISDEISAINGPTPKSARRYLSFFLSDT